MITELPLVLTVERINSTNQQYKLIIAFLVARFEARDGAIAFGHVLGFATGDPFPPHLETGPLHRLAHELNNVRFRDTELRSDRIERSAILPRHLHDAVDVFFRELGDAFI